MMIDGRCMGNRGTELLSADSLMMNRTIDEFVRE